MSDLFASCAPRIYSIPPGANFLEELATVLADTLDLKNNPEALADTLIYVPNRRSERALAFALHRVSPHQACLLPDIRALGDLETDDPPPSAETALADLPPILSPAGRIGGLTRLVLQYYESNDTSIPAASALSAARELARLLDQAALSGDVDWGKLEDLVADQQLQKHWDQSVKFLRIITDLWPAKLDEATAMDPYARRYAAAEAMAQEWQTSPPQTPVIIAGSTGATPASRLLMQAATQLPKGLIILPGLDRDVPENVWEEVAETPSHPQFTLARTLKSLGQLPHNIQDWPSIAATAKRTARRRLIHEALAPAQNTADWTERLIEMSPDRTPETFVESALEGLSLIDAGDDHDEAMLAALMLRETLETPDQTAALVTPDAGLARHISALLKQWNIDVPPSSGLPLSQTPAGSLILLVADWLTDPSHPVKLMAVLGHPYTRFDQKTVATLDRFFLRGPRLWHDWESLEQHLQNMSDPERRTRATYSDNDIEIANALLTKLGTILSSESKVAPPIEGAPWFTHISGVATELCDAPAPWFGEDGAALSNLIRHLVELSEPIGAQPVQIWNELLSAEALLVNVAIGAAHPRLAIWGPLEARLQTADRIILCGLNEGIWPAQPAADAFLPRIFRKEIGLADPDERIGLSAHDFAQLAAVPDVTLLFSQRRDDKPAIASRWIWRLRTLTRGALQNDAERALAPSPDRDPKAWLTALQNPARIPKSSSAEPRPTPPLSARPKGLSVTRIEQLVRDPYAIYAQYILGLYPLDPLNLPADVRVRGTAIHKALELFEDEAQDKSPAALLELLETVLLEGGEGEADLISLRARRLEVCEEYTDWRAAHKDRIEGKPILEERGSITIPIGSETFTLSGTADRIEKRVGGKAAILDFKSGKPPSEKQVRSGLMPQMPLQGLIAREGGYEGLGKAGIEALTYVQFGTQFDICEIGAGSSRTRLAEMPVEDIIAEAEAGLIKLLTTFANPDHPYLSAPRPQRVKDTYESNYTRLARRDEWVGLDTYD